MKRYIVTNLIRAIGIAIFYAVVFLYTIIFNNPTGWLLFFFLTLLLLWDVLTLIPALKKVHIQLMESTIYEVNQLKQIKLEIFRYRPTFFLFSLLKIVFKGTSPAKEQYLTLYSGQKKELIFEWRPNQRGIFQELPFVLVSSDLFWLFSKQATVTLKGPFVVMPTLQLDLAELIYQKLLTSTPILSAPFGNREFSIRNFRNYQVGDSLNSVDWKQSGKKNELIVKEYEHETKTDTHFLFYGLSDDNFELLLSIYHSFIHLVENRLTFQQTILADFPTSTTKEHTLAAVTPLSEECNLPTFTNKNLVVFAPNQTKRLNEQLDTLKKNNDLFLITFNAGNLCLYWKDQVITIDEGGHTLER